MLGRMHSRAYPGPTLSSRHGPVALCPRNLGCRLGHPAELKGHCPSLLHRLALPRVRRDASRLHHSVGIQRGYLCSGDASWLPLHSQGYITATSARPHTVLYAIPFLIQPNGDASRVPPLTWGCIVDASVDQGLHFLHSSPLLAHALSTGTAPQRAQFQPHTVEVEVATLCTRPLLLRTRSGSLS